MPYQSTTQEMVLDRDQADGTYSVKLLTDPPQVLTDVASIYPDYYPQKSFVLVGFPDSGPTEIASRGIQCDQKISTSPAPWFAYYGNYYQQNSTLTETIIPHEEEITIDTGGQMFILEDGSIITCAANDDEITIANTDGKTGTKKWEKTIVTGFQSEGSASTYIYTDKDAYGNDLYGWSYYTGCPATQMVFLKYVEKR